MLNKSIKVNKIKEILMILILFLYIFKGIAVKFHIEKLPYILSAFLMFICIVTSKGKIKTSKLLNLYLIIGIISIFITIFYISNNSIRTSIIGFISSYFNFILWYYILANYENNEQLLNIYIKIIIVFAVISSLLGIYQTLVDPTIKGMAINELYSNTELLRSGKIVRRATALLGSAQNYGLFVGIGFCSLLFAEKIKFKRKVIPLIILFIGVLVSGSRSASISLFIALFIKTFYILKSGKIKKSYIAITIFGLIALLIFASFFQIFDESTIKRLVDFNISPALKVYSNSMAKLDFKYFIFGKGLGYRDWTVNQLIGTNNYNLSFGENYTSAESFFMLIFLNSGIFRTLIYAMMISYSIYKMYCYSEKELLAMLVCLLVNQIFTPSFAGMAMSYAFWPLIIYAILTHKNQIIKRISI